MVDTTLFETSRMEQTRITGKHIKAELHFICFACSKSHPVSNSTKKFIEHFRSSRRKRMLKITNNKICLPCKEKLAVMIYADGKYMRRTPKPPTDQWSM
jgi:hypothetical protein